MKNTANQTKFVDQAFISFQAMTNSSFCKLAKEIGNKNRDNEAIFRNCLSIFATILLKFKAAGYCCAGCRRDFRTT
jgi:predicted NAD/FAD-binding protein